MQGKLRRRLVFLLLAAQVATVVALLATNGRISASAEADHTARLLSANAAESAEAVRSHLAPAETIVDLSSNLLVADDLEAEALESLFRRTLIRTPQMSGAFLGTPDGDFLFVSRDGENFIHKTISVEGTERTTLIETFDTDGELLDSFEDPNDEFDPTSRPWFIGAAEAQAELVWTDPYVFFTSGELGITASRAVVRDGELMGVVGSDIELGELSNFLGELDMNDQGGTILVDRNSTVVAHPNADLLRVPEGDGFRTVSILELEDSYAQSATGVLLNDDAGSGDVQDFEDETFGSSRVAFESVMFGNVDWRLGVYVPSGAIVEELTQARGQERLLTLLVGALTVLSVGLIALPATRRIGDLEEIASTDTLTGIANRRVIMEQVDELAAANGERSLAMLDIDFFKRVNDEHGHQVGDEVLKTTALRLAASLPDGAEIGRVGGEEFLIVLSETGLVEAERVADRLRQTIRGLPVATSIGEVDISVSIGVVSAAKPSRRDTLLAIADAALREAKTAGRDRVVVQRLNETAVRTS